MTASDATAATDHGRFVPEPAEVPVRPMPRLGRGIVWSDIVAEIERDELARARDAA